MYSNSHYNPVVGENTNTNHGLKAANNETFSRNCVIPGGVKVDSFNRLIHYFGLMNIILNRD